jgi:hypothetical protein
MPHKIKLHPVIVFPIFRGPSCLKNAIPVAIKAKHRNKNVGTVNKKKENFKVTEATIHVDARVEMTSHNLGMDLPVKMYVPHNNNTPPMREARW